MKYPDGLRPCLYAGEAGFVNRRIIAMQQIGVIMAAENCA